MGDRPVVDPMNLAIIGGLGHAKKFSAISAPWCAGRTCDLLFSVVRHETARWLPELSRSS